FPVLCFFYILMPLRPPSLPLFPYTTLFRSSFGRYKSIQTELEAVGLDEIFTNESARGSWQQSQAVSGGEIFLVRARRIISVCREDRKSTRLNSSHVKNSYVVCCLKKKKQQY